MRFPAWWRRLSSRDARALRLAVLVVAPAVAWSALIRPVAASFGRLGDHLDQERDLYRREMQLLAQGPALVTALQRRTTALREASPLLFSGQDSVTAAADLVAYVTELASTTGVVVQATEPSVSSAADGLLRLRVEVRAASDLLGLIDWLDGLEQGEKLVRIAQLSVTPSSEIGSPTESADLLGLTVVVEGFALLAPESPHEKGLGP